MNNKLEVIQGKNVDIISPFPSGEVGRIYGWIRSFKSIIEFDDWLNGRQEFKDFYKEKVIPNTKTYGVIDKHNLTLKDVNVPIVGFFMAETPLPTNTYIQFASNLKALNAGLIDEAMDLIKKDIYSKNEKNLRISAWLLEGNVGARKFLTKHGFIKECKIPAMITQKGRPKALIHMGSLRQE